MGKGWQSHSLGRGGAGSARSRLCLCSRREPQALFPTPRSLLPAPRSPFPLLLSSRKLPANKSTADLQFPPRQQPGQGGPASPSCQGAPPQPRVPPFPRGKGFPAACPSSCKYVVDANAARQLPAPQLPCRGNQVGWGCLATLLLSCSYTWQQQPLTQPCRASLGPAVHIKQNKWPEKQG